MSAIRWTSSLILAALLTLLLFYVMQALIARGGMEERELPIMKVVDATMPDIEMLLVEEVPKPLPIEPLDELPPPVSQRVFNTTPGPQIPVSHLDVGTPALVIDDNSTFLVSDGDMLPLVNVVPTYPSRAIQNRVEGWAQVRFTVTPTGTVRDVEVIDAEPERVFDRASIQAAEKFRFQPRVVNGEAVEVPGVQYVFRYQLEGER